MTFVHAHASLHAQQLPQEAVKVLFAYLDPASGSMLLQILAAIFFGTAALARSYWTYLTSLFVKRPKTSDADSNLASGDEDQGSRKAA